MATFARRDVFKITEMRRESVYKTQFVCSIWVNLNNLYINEQRIAQEAGGDMLVTPTNFKRDPWPKKFDREDEWFREE
jgi:hypothetical protein